MNALMGEPQQVGLIARAQVEALAELGDGLLECRSASLLKLRRGAPRLGDFLDSALHLLG
jgi:hypothetical protein